MRVLLAGWFSFDEVIATVGDELGADVVAGWLTDAGVDHDVAWAPYLQRGVDWRDVDPAGYTHLVFVSGPLADRPLLRELTAAFAGARRWAVNVSVVQESARGLFHRVWERDAAGLARPDLAVEGPDPDAPVLAVAFTPAQGEYGERSQAERVRGAIEEWLADRALPWFELDMDLYEKPHARRPAQVEALVRRADVLVSMRLHALVLGLKHGRPVVACDPIAGGAKVTAQAAALDWPLVLPAEEVTAEALDAALQRALSGALDGRVRAAAGRGREGNARARAWFAEQLAG
ncbi:polysaccharide pyruvyl transferase family protein [Geodermatophilus sp. DSM 44513]|uniref:polysaccharide pyruvyl transferase family protein n=1 Tax=Geodermatophilus sp. DSM 44513 TaxID=1528104 RepID=UPI001288FECC|nr:polysaccharide pyruvyl transferase family protein [Geodermatophilus sp. DSM 44513]WNV74677.1 polysaccharide pyruvyl transferase family protein [Geodermatophilus sp. DSM 44513]